LAVGFVGVNFFQGSVVGGNLVGSAPYFCPVNDNGDISFGSVSSDCTSDVRGYFPFSNGGPDTSFWLQIKSIDDGQRVDVSPVSKWLIENGYRTGSEDYYPNIRMHDLEWNRNLRNKIESGTTCSASISPNSRSEFTFNGDQYHEHWDGYKDTNDLFSSTANVEAEEVRITEHRVFCKFNLGEVMEGATGKDFNSLREAGEVSLYGENSYEGTTGMTVDFGIDSDLDGERDSEDACPQEPGIPEKGGCPNEPSTVESLDGPRNVTVEESATYSVQVSNPDGDETSISWSNGETGESATYSWNSTGTKTVSVTVDDGFDERTEEVSVQVGEKTLLGSLSEFFSQIWSVLTFSG
jgi:hypothetical protein